MSSEPPRRTSPHTPSRRRRTSHERLDVDLSTTYLGMRLRSPIVASAGPLTGDRASWARSEEAGAGAIVLPSLFEEQIERESFAVDATLDSGRRHVRRRRSSYLPEIDDHDDGPGSASRPRRGGPGPAVDSGHRQPQRHVARRLGALRPSPRERRRARDRAEHLRRRRRSPRRARPTSSSGTSNWSRMFAPRSTVPLAVKLGPWFTSLGPLRSRPRSSRRQRAGAVQPLLPTRHRPRHARRHATAAAVHLGRVTAAAALDRHPAGLRVLLARCARPACMRGPTRLKLLLVGADVAMTASALLRHGPNRIADDARLDRANG